MTIKLSPEFQHELQVIAKQLGACKETKEDLWKVNTFARLLKFLEEYHQDIDEKYFDWLLEKEEELECLMRGEAFTPEKIMDYMNSPFVSDFDKNRIKDFIINKKI